MGGYYKYWIHGRQIISSKVGPRTEREHLKPIFKVNLPGSFNLKFLPTGKSDILLFNHLTAGAAYIRVFIFYSHIKYHILNMLKIKCDINQQVLKLVDLHFVNSE